MEYFYIALMLLYCYCDGLFYIILVIFAMIRVPRVIGPKSCRFTMKLLQKNAITVRPCVQNMFVSMVTGNMVRGLDEEESSFLDEVSRQQCLVEKQRRDEEKKELLEYRISFLWFLKITC